MLMRTRSLLLVAILAVGLLLLGACGGGAEPASEAEAPAAAAVVEEAPAEDAARRGRPQKAEADTEPAEEEVVEIEAAEEEDAGLAGEIVISVSSNDIQTYQALADAYMELNPDVNVLVELKAGCRRRWAGCLPAMGAHPVCRRDATRLHHRVGASARPGSRGTAGQLGALSEQGQPLHRRKMGGELRGLGAEPGARSQHRRDVPHALRIGADFLGLQQGDLRGSRHHRCAGTADLGPIGRVVGEDPRRRLHPHRHGRHDRADLGRRPHALAHALGHGPVSP